MLVTIFVLDCLVAMQHNTTSTPPRTDEFAFHPQNVMLIILLMGLSVLFLALTASYVYHRVTMQVPPIQVPWLFLLNTLILLGSSYTMISTKRAYLADDTAAYQNRLKQTIVLSCLFVIMQCVAWYWLFQHNVNLKTSTAAGYLYVISFLHLLHVIGGMPFLLLFYRAAKRNMVDPVTVLIYFSDPAKRLKLRLLTIYWHFLDILWVYLVVFLGINYLI